jgi:hypothetical protein
MTKLSREGPHREESLRDKQSPGGDGGNIRHTPIDAPGIVLAAIIGGF